MCSKKMYKMQKKDGKTCVVPGHITQNEGYLILHKYGGFSPATLHIQFAVLRVSNSKRKEDVLNS